MRQFRHTWVVLVGAGFLALGGCSSSTAPGNTNVNGPTVSIGSGSAYMYLVKNPSGAPVGAGAAITGAAIASLTQNASFILPWNNGPMQVELDYTTTDAAPYNKPHLDAYFFIIEDSTFRKSILAGPDTVTIPSIYIPNGYQALTSIDEAGKGVRYGDINAPELHGEPFQSAFYDGFYRGNPSYQEVSVDRTFLTSKWQGSVSVKQPSNYFIGPLAAYAGTYSLHYDGGSDTYFIELDSLTEPMVLIN